MSWIRYLVAFALFIHGLAHLSGFFAAWTRADVGYPAKPWLFSKNVTLKSPLGKVFGLLWPVAALALVAGGVGLALGQGWWPGAALLAGNSWVRVRGAVEASTLDGQRIPLIKAESVESAAEPSQPYLYP